MELPLGPPAGAIAPASRVRLAGLQGRQELNGLEGTVLEWLPEGGRWKVVTSDGVLRKYRRANLLVLDGSADVDLRREVNV
mmetsp:Transcript_129306/g.414521  ORF Transcript_129306/g.414521 Transcript_129306/m.414521 type:complete len:81 (+) Transcript_129306:61-303(+)